MRLVLAAGFIFAHVLAASQTRIRGVPPEGGLPLMLLERMGRIRAVRAGAWPMKPTNRDNVQVTLRRPATVRERARVGEVLLR